MTNAIEMRAVEKAFGNVRIIQDLNLTVAKGSNSGQVLRLKGRGAFDARTAKRGDLFARLIVTLPAVPDPELEAFSEAWRAQRPYSPAGR